MVDDFEDGLGVTCSFAMLMQKTVMVWILNLM